MEWFSSIRKAQRFAGSGKRNKNSAKCSFLFLSTPAMVSHIKKCYTNYDIIVHRAARLPHGTQTAVRTALPKRRRLFYGKKCDRRSIRRPHLSHQFQPGRRLCKKKFPEQKSGEWRRNNKDRRKRSTEIRSQPWFIWIGLIEKIACPQSERGRLPIRNKISRNGSRPQQAAHRSGMF